MIIDQQLRLQRHYNFPEVYESNPFEKSVIEDTFHAKPRKGSKNNPD